MTQKHWQRSWLLWSLGSLLGVLVGGILFGGSFALPQRIEGVNPEPFLLQVKKSVGWEFWRQTKHVSWSLRGVRRCRWDRVGARLACVWFSSNKAAMSVQLAFHSGEVWVGQGLDKAAPKSLWEPWVRLTRRAWKRDRAQLFPWGELFSTRNRLAVVRFQGKRGLLVEIRSSRGTRHVLLMLGKAGTLEETRHWGPSLWLQGQKVRWEKWQRLATGVWVSQKIQSLGENRFLDEVTGAKKIPPMAHGSKRWNVSSQPQANSTRATKGSLRAWLGSFSISRQSWWFLGFAVWLLLGVVLKWMEVRGRASAFVHRWEFPVGVEHPLRMLYRVPGWLPASLCQGIIQEAEASEWRVERHTQPTLDQPLSALPNHAERLASLFRCELFPWVAQSYGLEEGSVGLREAFVIKYDARSRNKLELHRDASVLTVLFALNDANEYKGGGTYFPLLGQELVLERAGDALCHCGKVQHGGAPVVKGVRYLLVCFLDCRGSAQISHEEVATWNSAEPGDAEVLRRIWKPASEDT